MKNKSARICSNIFGDSVIQSLKSGKNMKSDLVLMSRQEKLVDLILVFPSVLEIWQKGFHSYSNVPEMRSLGMFWSILSNGYHGNDDRYKNFDFSFGYVFASSIHIQNFITIK